MFVCSLRGLALPGQRESLSPAHCADPVAPSFLELDSPNSLNGDVKGRPSWVLCWEQPVLDALLSSPSADSEAASCLAERSVASGAVSVVAGR